MHFRSVTTVFCLLFAADVYAQTDVLRQKVNTIVNAYQADVGVAILDLAGQDTLTVHGRRHYPMQSVYKFPLALAVLDLVDRGKLRLNQQVHVTKADLLPTYSPLRKKYPEGNIDISVLELLQYTVSHSDNNACDILFRLIGGTAVAAHCIHNLWIKDIAITATEEEMSRSWDVQFKNWTTPLAMAHLLKGFYDGKNLTAGSRDLLWKLMLETTTGPKRIKAPLPAGTPVAHRTGTSNTNEQGVTAATNDVGIVTLPDGNAFIIVVFVSNSKETPEVNEKIIAEVSRAAWDHFSQSSKGK